MKEEATVGVKIEICKNEHSHEKEVKVSSSQRELGEGYRAQIILV